MKVGREEMEAAVNVFEGRLNKMALVANREKLEAVALHQEIPNEEAAVEMIRALKDQSGDWCLAVRCRRQLTHCAAPTLCESCSHKGLTVEKRQWKGLKCNNGIRDCRLKQQLHLGSETVFNKNVRQTLGLEVAKRSVRSSIWLWEVSEWTLWSVGPLRNERRDIQSTALRKEQK
jgi:hypothetical protein